MGKTSVGTASAQGWTHSRAEARKPSTAITKCHATIQVVLPVLLASAAGDKHTRNIKKLQRCWLAQVAGGQGALAAKT